MAACVHKSALIPAQMKEAGFALVPLKGEIGRSPLYLGDPDRLSLADHDFAVGLGWASATQEVREDWRGPYVDLLERSLAMAEDRTLLGAESTMAVNDRALWAGSTWRRVTRSMRNVWSGQV